ncbi:TPA: hypothetical protein N0F65_000359 (mitochondrion) [Lagenidium giganteum]|uniref:Uncharacterized protein n=1 Tax=Lagenidium giganteum TaxID=4803 RepID=A0AAV2YHG5_9STRA|nr:TPA: hypothetical protein N0F65_000359 [Lagenidium giganteum]
MLKYIKFTIREFLGLENDYESLLSNQDQILDQLKQLEKLEIQNQELILEEYFNIKNALWVLFILGFIGGGFWLYNTDFFNNSTLESIKSLGTLSKDFHAIDHNGVLDALKKLNENSVNLSKEEIKLLLEIKNLLLKKGIDENPSLDRPINLEGTFTLGNPISGVDN